MNKTNCPNCGAPITGPKCEYCDTIFIDEKKEAIAECCNHMCDCSGSLIIKMKELWSAEKTKELYEEAIKAMKKYSERKRFV